MSTGGVVYKDLLPIPDTDPTEHEGKSATLRDAPTDSHALALDAARVPPTEEKGAAQVEHQKEVVDLGWNEPKEHVAKPLVGGLDNEHVWMLVRRFNKQIYQVKQIPTAPPGGLDLNVADEEEFTPDKLRANLERIYMTIIIGIIGFAKHIARIRSWRETRRTAWFCSAYFAAWTFDMIMPLLSVTLLTLIVHPPAREVMFPPAPIALVSSSGGVQKPKSGTLGSVDSVTGAPENHKGEAVEQEATNFVYGFATIALSSATGKQAEVEPKEEDSPDSDIPDTTRLALGVAHAQDKASGNKPDKDHDKTRVPMETAMWSKMRPIMHAVSDVADTWERFANMLDPNPPFPQNKFRLRLGAVVAPMIFISLFVSSYVFMKGVTFGIGFGFFGDPVIQRGLALLDRKFPKWKKLLELRNTLLKGVPTNAQLTITLLRLGEANKAPLPPPPHMTHPPAEQTANVDSEELRAMGVDRALNATKEELDDAIAYDPEVGHEASGEGPAKDSKHVKKGSKMLSFFRGTAKGAVETTRGADKVKAAAGSIHAKNRLGALPPRNADLTSGPVEFKARFDGRKGHAYIATKSTIPCIAFSTDKTIEKIGSVDREDLHPLWSVPVSDIIEIKKVGGFGWKAKMVVGWVMERELADGLIITDSKFNEYRIMALPLRDELFNRLIAMGGQKWESW
ncbi:hypothetical protein J3E72DRAFT_249759 [Bipolaris maydis]|nr:hypothetical protein BM1_08443 [Bipolaris maydis]KAJ6194462.1 hypothetical protein J3E72DRAFT_249759 [Bipolaris maydis]KAJ6281223.1 hypothetical protein J3E71DRAFT_353788 [Bipolaris maydis]